MRTALFLSATPVEEAWQNGYTGKGQMMIESKDHIDVWSGLNQCEREGVHIGGINEHLLDISDRCRHDLSQKALRTDQSDLLLAAA